MERRARSVVLLGVTNYIKFADFFFDFLADSFRVITFTCEKYARIAEAREIFKTKVVVYKVSDNLRLISSVRKPYLNALLGQLILFRKSTHTVIVSEKALEEATKQHQKLLDFIFDKLQDKLSAVRLTRRLTDSACCLVGESNSISPQLERLLKAMNQTAPESKRVLEINPKHPVVEVMQKLIDEDPTSEKLAQYTDLLYGEALLTEGSPLPDPLAFVKNVSALMK